MGTKWIHLTDKLRYAGYLLIYLTAAAVSVFVRKRPAFRNLWLISERGVDAGDNGYHFFKYLCENHKDINAAFVISPSSPDRGTVEPLGKLIDFGSFEHYLAILLAEVKISTHIMGFTPDMYFFTELDRLHLVPGKKVFLQHGIIKDDLPYLYGNHVRLDLFVSGAKKEADYLIRAFGHPAGVIQYLGLCRYDALPVEKNSGSRFILFMPTWRSYLKDISEKEFLESRYFKEINGLLEDIRLSALLSKYGFRLIFCPHHEVQKFLGLFRPSSGEIETAAVNGSLIQELLIRTDILITDFSSVFFDFAYMRKPVIYYQFDRERFRGEHYREGYFSYERDGFGPVTAERGALFEELERLMARGCIPEQRYLLRAGEFFPVRDQNNCRRNYEAVESIVRAGGIR